MTPEFISRPVGPCSKFGIEPVLNVAAGFKWCVEMFLILLHKVSIDCLHVCSLWCPRTNWFLKKRNCGKYPLSSQSLADGLLSSTVVLLQIDC